MEALARTAERTRVPLMDLRREYRAHRTELLAACERVFGRMQLFGGEEVRAFEAEAAAYLGVRHVGSFGAAGAFSLGVVKNLAAYGDAGMVATDDGALAEHIRLLGAHGQVKKNEHAFFGTNSRLDELQAALLRVKLRALDARNRRRADIAAYYSGRLGEVVVTPPCDPSRFAVYHQYVVRTPQRERLRTYLAERDIETGIHYPVPIHRQPAWLRSYGEGPALPRAERAAREILSLPVHADLTDEEVEHVADGVRDFFR